MLFISLLGFEPRFQDSESRVLPLDDKLINAIAGIRTQKPLRVRDFKSRAFANFATIAINTSTGARTQDPRIKNPLLYQLSYGDKKTS